MAVGTSRSDALADHLGDCRQCAEEYRALRSLAPRPESARRLSSAILPIAALVLIATALGSYAYFLARENSRLRARTAVAPSQPRPVELPVPIEKPRSPAVNVALVELLPASALVRGGSTPPPANVPAADAFTIILHTDGQSSFRDYAVELADGANRVLWRGERLRPSAEGPFVLHFDRDFIGSGKRVITLYGIASDTHKKIETYQLVVAER